MPPSNPSMSPTHTPVEEPQPRAAENGSPEAPSPIRFHSTMMAHLEVLPCEAQPREGTQAVGEPITPKLVATWAALPISINQDQIWYQINPFAVFSQ